MSDQANDKQTTDVLNDVLEYLHDSYNGYQECAKTVCNKELEELFKMLSTDREKMIKELEGEIQSFDQTPIKQGSVLGFMHRLFVDLKNLLTGGDNEAIVNEVKRGEHLLITHYESALEDENLPGNLQMLLKRQLNSIRENLKKVEITSEQQPA